MNKELVIKELPGFDVKAKIGKINVALGDKIEEGETLLTLEGSKATKEVEAEFSGELMELHIKEGDEVEKDTSIGVIRTADNVEEEKEILVNCLPGFDVTGKIGKINISPGDEVKEGDCLLSIEGSKATKEVEAEEAGKILDLSVEEGDEVKVGDLLLKLGVEKSAATEVSKKVKVEEDELFAQVVVLGGGPGGYVAAIRASQNGKSVILIEEDTLGGTCLNRGCIPTKSMVQSTKVKDTIDMAEIFGIENASGDFSMNKIIDRKNKVVDTLVSGLDCSMAKHKIRVLNGRGYGNTRDSLLVKVDGKEVIVKFENLILAPGSVVSKPNFEGAFEDDILTSDELLELREIPESLIILGGRVIAMEFAFIYKKLGAEVTVVQRSDTIFPNLDDDIIEHIRESALNLGINLVEGSNVKAIKSNIDRSKTLIIEQDGEEKYIYGEKLAIATGRKPNLEGLNLDKLGVEICDKTWGIKVNDKMQTTNENIYAIGDATNIFNLAHVASKHGIIAADNICGANIEMEYSAIPEAIFTDPEIGLVGMSEKMCKERNIEYVVGKFPYMNNGKALVENDCCGFIKVIAEKESRKIIGAGLIGLLATDLLSVFTNLIANENTIDEAQDVIYAHPTVSETAFEAILDLDEMSIHK